MSKLIIKFPDDKARDAFMSTLSDGGGEDGIYECMSMHGLIPRFDYSKAFRPDDGEDPVINVTIDACQPS